MEIGKIMKQEAIKLELIEWLAKLNDSDTIQYLKKIKDAVAKNQDWWNDLPEHQKKGIMRGLKDIDDGRTIPHDEVKAKYGL
ncbi:MAG TPA: hypothetical protein PLR50_11980 [Candidatus Rifleibacterium sp.]|nr:hypothetical protein [Candidatus Rifleibacterium sp.]